MSTPYLTWRRPGLRLDPRPVLTWLRSPLAIASLVCLAAVGLGAALAVAPIVVAAAAGVAILMALFLTRSVPWCFAALVLLQPLMPTSQRPVPVIGFNLQEWTLGAGFVLGSILLLGRVLAGDVRATLSFTWPDRLVLVLFTWTGLSLLQANDPAQTTRIFARVMFFSCEMYILGRWFWTHWPVARVAALLAAAGVATTALLWLEFLVGQPLYVAESEYLANWVIGGFRAGSMLNGPNFASVCLAQCFAAAAYMATVTRATRRWVWVGAATVITTGLVATQSISGMIQFAVVVLALAWHRLAWLVRIGLIVGGLGIALSPIPQAVMENPLIASHSVSIYGRFDLLATAREAITSLWTDPVTILFGVGYWREAFIESQFAVGTIASAGRDVSLHNAFLTLAIESGLPAAAAFAGLLVVVALGLYRGRPRGSVAIAALAGLAFVVASGSGTTTTLPQVLGMFMFVAAGAAGGQVRATPPAPGSQPAVS